MTSPDSPVALYGSEHSSLVGNVAATLPTSAAADIGVINFNCSAERPIILIKQRTNPIEHAPRGFVGDAGFTLNLLSRDAAAGLRHKVNSVEPQAKRGAGILKNGSRCGMLMVSAPVTRVGWPTLNSVVLRDLPADLAEDAFWVQVIAQPVKTGLVGWEVSLEVSDGVLSHGSYLPFGDSIP